VRIIVTETRGSTQAPQRPPSRGTSRQRTGPGLFYRQIVAELRKVVRPTRKELVTYTSVVVVFVLMVIAYVSLLDYGFGKAVLEIFG
jgi:preprotein translocase subunit SecE